MSLNLFFRHWQVYKGSEYCLDGSARLYKAESSFCQWLKHLSSAL